MVGILKEVVVNPDLTLGTYLLIKYSDSISKRPSAQKNLTSHTRFLFEVQQLSYGELQTHRRNIESANM